MLRVLRPLHLAAAALVTTIATAGCPAEAAPVPVPRPTTMTQLVVTRGSSLYNFAVPVTATGRIFGEGTVTITSPFPFVANLTESTTWRVRFKVTQIVNGLQRGTYEIVQGNLPPNTGTWQMKRGDVKMFVPRHRAPGRNVHLSNIRYIEFAQFDGADNFVVPAPGFPRPSTNWQDGTSVEPSMAADGSAGSSSDLPSEDSDEEEIEIIGDPDGEGEYESTTAYTDPARVDAPLNGGEYGWITTPEELVMTFWMIYWSDDAESTEVVEPLPLEPAPQPTMAPQPVASSISTLLPPAPSPVPAFTEPATVVVVP